jgi:hypothetical protein
MFCRVVPEGSSTEKLIFRYSKDFSYVCVPFEARLAQQAYSFIARTVSIDGNRDVFVYPQFAMQFAP